MTYSADFRRLALRLLHQEGSYRKAARVCNISTSTLHRWKSAGTALKKRQFRPLSRQSLQAAAHVCAIFLQSPLVTLEDARRSLREQFHIALGKHAIRNIVRNHLRLSRKRAHKKTGQCTWSAEQLATFRAKLLQRLQQAPPMIARLPPVVSIDECYFSEKDAAPVRIRPARTAFHSVISPRFLETTVAAACGRQRRVKVCPRLPRRCDKGNIPRVFGRLALSRGISLSPRQRGIPSRPCGLLAQQLRANPDPARSSTPSRTSSPRSRARSGPRGLGRPAWSPPSSTR